MARNKANDTDAAVAGAIIGAAYAGPEGAVGGALVAIILKRLFLD